MEPRLLDLVLVSHMGLRIEGRVSIDGREFGLGRTEVPAGDDFVRRQAGSAPPRTLIGHCCHELVDVRAV